MPQGVLARVYDAGVPDTEPDAKPNAAAHRVSDATADAGSC